MADEFVDLYEVLGLPLDADREVLRKRINEKYLEAQRNLDHRNFQTRVKFQELFEVTMPQARYILLDPGRRAEYDHMVATMRAAQAGTAAPSAPPPTPTKPKKSAPNVPSRSNPALGTGSTAGFRLARPETGPAGQAPSIDPLPVSGYDAARHAKERDELWRKWKSGLEEALAREKDAEPAPKPATSAPVRPAAAPASQPRAEAQPSVNFDFTEAEQSALEQERQLQQQQEQGRINHRRQIMKDMLEGVGLKGTLIGAASVVVPGVAAMLAFMFHYYPRNARPLLHLSQGMAWLIWGAVIVLGAAVLARVLSKSMRRSIASQLNALSYEDLVRRAGRN